MVLYFSGTGNSRHAAKKIAEILGDELLDINERIKSNDFGAVEVSKRLVFVTPTYAWRIPNVVTQWISKTIFLGAKSAWFVMTCGGEIGNAEKYNKKLCGEKGFSYMGTAQILMPENYVALFKTPEKAEARRIAEKAEPEIESAAKIIGEEKRFKKPRNNLYDRFMSGPVNVTFYPLCVKAKAFRVTGGCVGCGKCEKLCPLNNIELKNKKPVWGNNCTHCMACINYCPVKAIEYGKSSEKRPRYCFEEL